MVALRDHSHEGTIACSAVPCRRLWAAQDPGVPTPQRRKRAGGSWSAVGGQCSEAFVEGTFQL